MRCNKLYDAEASPYVLIFQKGEDGWGGKTACLVRSRRNGKGNTRRNAFLFGCCCVIMKAIKAGEKIASRFVGEKNMTATILIDNQTKSDLAPEWGLAIWIEYSGHIILLDTGETGKFIENADAMKLEIGQVEFGVLSHAHHDHANGLAAFFKRNQTAKFYLRHGCEENCYGRKWLFSRYIGIQKGYLEQYRDRIVFADGAYEIMPGVTLLPHTTPHLERLGKKAGMYVKQNGMWRPDGFLHEQSLVLQTGKGLVIWNSCSHGGADNIIREVADAYPNETIYALVGGFHLYASPEREVRALASRIRETGIEKIYTGHCTGENAIKILREELGDRVEQIYTGMNIVIPDR